MPKHQAADVFKFMTVNPNPVLARDADIARMFPESHECCIDLLNIRSANVNGVDITHEREPAATSFRPM